MTTLCRNCFEEHKEQHFYRGKGECFIIFDGKPLTSEGLWIWDKRVTRI
jgi:hypothetical protein